MSKIAARLGSLYLDDSSGACQSLTCYVNSIALTFSAETTDLTSFCDDNRERATDGLRDWELSMEGFWASGATETDGVLSGIRAAGGSTIFWFYPTGSAAASPVLYSGCGVLTSYECNFTAEDSAQISFTVAARSGSLTRS